MVCTEFFLKSPSIILAVFIWMPKRGITTGHSVYYLAPKPSTELGSKFYSFLSLRGKHKELKRFGSSHGLPTVHSQHWDALQRAADFVDQSIPLHVGFEFTRHCQGELKPELDDTSIQRVSLWLLWTLTSLSHIQLCAAEHAHLCEPPKHSSTHVSQETYSQ